MTMHTGLIELNWTTPMLLINVFILYLILKRFFFEKIHNFMLARQDAVQEAFESAEQASKLADKKMQEYEEQIAGVEQEGRELIKDAKMRADNQAQLILEGARKEAAELKSIAERQIEGDKSKALADMKEQVADLAVLAAEKIVERELTDVGQNEIVDQIIEQAGKEQW